VKCITQSILKGNIAAPSGPVKPHRATPEVLAYRTLDYVSAVAALPLLPPARLAWHDSAPYAKRRAHRPRAIAQEVIRES